VIVIVTLGLNTQNKLTVTGGLEVEDPVRKLGFMAPYPSRGPITAKKGPTPPLLLRRWFTILSCMIEIFSANTMTPEQRPANFIFQFIFFKIFGQKQTWFISVVFLLLKNKFYRSVLRRSK